MLSDMNTTRSAAPKKPTVKLTAEQRKQVRSLIEDSGYTRAEAVAWVTEMGGAA